MWGSWKSWWMLYGHLPILALLLLNVLVSMILAFGGRLRVWKNGGRFPKLGLEIESRRRTTHQEHPHDTRRLQ